ncbi:MAG: flavodoxin-dependent (E)-4-hydroxy-3-methylbut-2-enyl-diphosphate synthase [Deltaproteobacteria bacterium]|nr:flavodoxin-dependent (E)-4-hydroxy-3-methylbut-2-enyl-diphosphate synthase [Deltaproteobacteria bacterium]MBW2051992.1 flavodoxin-dependent (E)-4-hydroxy-3-methylbut-2-enyl-diphosphate synthase [Deltaproteobacteria bacterium]MBW2140076.1 flavodoxin-dependent (E)-4-hydroxy-3-methylbut-2-enyl-diphosphate synthase [Deltaproteobacteria bacterium]MBW2322529.1 flavodoxin-dependent (E)-4-hydroxy-3-methylbut-2-enyl-diphosphate synthase [Deltaproteobacteria bacterium]
MTKRSQTKRLYIRDVAVGGGAPVIVQSMTNTDTRDTEATCAQIARLAEAGCELVRVAVPDEDAALALKRIIIHSSLPVIADIHFDHRLALMALDQGVDGLRLNPGNIGGRAEVRKVAVAAKSRGVPIRVGVNAGSLDKDLLEKYGRPSPEAMVESAQKEIALLEDADFDMIKISVKSSDVMDTVAAYRLMAQKTDYPLHLGVTETGTLISGTVKSSLGLGLLLSEGLGDTVRVSLTRDPVDEVRVAYEILRAVDLRHRGPEIISCPTCGRCEIDLFSLVEEVENRLSRVVSPIKVAVMGCVVNGPGEARSARVGVAGGRGQGVLFKEGKLVSKIPEKDLANVLVNEVNRLLEKEKLSD